MVITNQAKVHLAIAAACGIVAGCVENPSPPTITNPPAPVIAPDQPPKPDEQPSAPVIGDPTNTGVNERDRDGTEKTPLDQNENQADINFTAEIRKQVVDAKLSVDAQNVKIITQDGKVTLRGPVATEDEKTRIGEIAEKVSGPGNVDNQLEVTTP